MTNDVIDNDKPVAFAKPIIIAGETYTHFKLREPSIKDMFDAELESARVGGGQHTPLLFNGHMMVIQLVQVCDESGNNKFEGPFTMGILQKWGPKNYRAIRAEQLRIDLLGEAVLSDSNPD